MLAAAAARGIKTVDLVPAGRNHSERRQAFLEMVRGGPHELELYSAADLRVEDIPGGIEKVLILPSRAEYERRYKECCEMRPEERAQGITASTLYLQFTLSSRRFDRVLDHDDSVDSALDELLARYRWSRGRRRETGGGWGERADPLLPKEKEIEV